MRGLLRGEKGQAATEIAILGSLIILAFSYLITFTAKINMRQEIIQNTFRSLLVAANGSGQSQAKVYTYTRMPNILEPYVPGELKRVPAASGSVLWSPGDPDNVLIGFDPEDDYTENLKYKKTFTKTEKEGGYPYTQWEVEWKEGSVTKKRAGPN